MNVLILTFQAGEGHNSAASAVREALEERGHTATVVDFLGLYSDKISNLINKTYVKTVQKAPLVFGISYKTLLLFCRIFNVQKTHSFIYLGSKFVSEKLTEYMEKNGPYDAVVATHLMPAQALSCLKSHGYPIAKTVAVATDYSCYPFWEEAYNCDYYIIPHECLIGEYVKRNIPFVKLMPYGIPVSTRFHDTPGKDEARERLGIQKDANYFLVMGGSMGAGHISAFVKKMRLSLGENKMIVICGRNEKLYNACKKAVGDDERITLVGFTREIPLYLSACDVLYTKPGGLTSSEALASNIPIIHTNPIPGCESDNYFFFLQNGCAYSAKNVDKQIRNGISLIQDKKLQEKIKECQRAFVRRDSAERIAKLIESDND